MAKKPTFGKKPPKPATAAQKRARHQAGVKAARTRAKAVAAMSPKQKKAVAVSRHKAAVKAARTRVQHQRAIARAKARGAGPGNICVAVALAELGIDVEEREWDTIPSALWWCEVTPIGVNEALSIPGAILGAMTPTGPHAVVVSPTGTLLSWGEEYQPDEFVLDGEAWLVEELAWQSIGTYIQTRQASVSTTHQRLISRQFRLSRWVSRQLSSWSSLA